MGPSTPIFDIVKKVWATDQSKGFKIFAWISAVALWQISDSTSFLRVKYNAYRFEQALMKSEESIANNLDSNENRSSMQHQIAKIKSDNRN
jgi:hypothetical protein